MEGTGCFFRFEISNVLADNDTPTVICRDSQRDRVFQMRACSNSCRQCSVYRNRQRRISARPADDLRPFEKIADDRIIDMAADWPVVHQKEVCDFAETFEGIVL